MGLKYNLVFFLFVFLGSLYSGNTTGDDEFNKDKSNQSLDAVDNDLSDDENGFDIRCEVCDKTFNDLDR